MTLKMHDWCNVSGFNSPLRFNSLRFEIRIIQMNYSD